MNTFGSHTRFPTSAEAADALAMGIAPRHTATRVRVIGQNVIEEVGQCVKVADVDGFVWNVPERLFYQTYVQHQ
jgi:hypothetical protein